MQYIHLGVLQVRVQILHRQREGTMALIVFRDNRWQGDQAILATMEADLTHGSQMIYVIPEIMMTIGDFYRNIQISVLTRGYEAWQKSEANLLITRGLVRRLSNTPNVGFAYEIQDVMDYLTSHGVKALPGRNFSTRILPKRQTEGSAGLDIAASHVVVIEPYGRDLIHTGLRIEIPYGYYGRLASRLGLAWKYSVEVGAGVIDSDYQGVLQVRVQILHRQREGTMALIAFRDNRWQRDQAILVTMEVNLTHGSQMIYVIPEIMMTIGDFYRNFQISVLTRGYEAWQKSEANLLITRRLVGQAWKYGVEVGVGVIDSDFRGTMALIVFRDNRWQEDEATLATMEVDLTHGSQMIYVIPEIMMSIHDFYRNIQISVLTRGYEAWQKSEANLLITRGQVGRLSNTPNVGFAYEIQGLDIAASHAAVIEPYGQNLINTGLRIEIPYGYYGRLTSRSRQAWKYGVEVGAGVIDSDYRGEVQVLLFN
ncbi:hypothetical protein ZIOFF_047671 [Zingiber officinale]|uniref:dUTP diphosphatase n=1 Tax=Zingiber officinale TaxID=94328 RepID=A0A8J5KL77_ZINOF|nr:hypothetical protein ZIOFF_047671 [Zingiber officinale]